MAELSITMDDSIPQQAGPGAGADELWKQRHERVVEWAHDVFNNKLHPINMAHMVHAMYHLAAPLAVEDSRERCASSDAKHVEGFLCRAWGESDLTAASLCGDMAAVRQFLIDEWLGEESSPDWEGKPILPGVMDELASYNWADESNVWQTEFEIGGLSVERVTFLAAMAAASSGKEKME